MSGIKAKLFQVKHIDERPILEFLAAQEGWSTHWPTPVISGERMRNGLPSIIDGVPALRDVPEKVLRRKLASMKRRGLIDGCPCGCRGDWEITRAGRAAIESGPVMR